MLTARRLVLGLLLLLLLVAAAWTGWLVLQLRDDLTAAQDAGERLRNSVGEDADARQAATEDLRDAAASAADRTDGPWWTVLTWVPVVGDDAAAVRSLTTSLDTVAGEGLEPLGRVVDLLPQVSGDGRIDVGTVRELQRPVGEAHAALAAASDEVAGVDAADLSGTVRGRFQEYVDLVGDAESGLRSGLTATEVLPAMLGAQESKRYLLVFENNAEIRATGGLPGSWATVEADNGDLRLVQQGTGSAFGELDQPLPLSDAERKIYSPVHGSYFLDANFTPDFPRAAELWQQRWALDFPERPLDGVVALDPITLSYLLEGTGPIEAGGTTLTSDTIVETLLSKPYVELEPQAQDALFAGTARAVFDAVSGDLESPVDFVQGLSRAAGEGRFKVAAFDEQVADQLAGTRVLGALAGDDGDVPHVDVGLNDATGSKMSYYLRYRGDVRAQSCTDGVQSLEGSLTLRQSISPQDARELPDSVTGSGAFGTERGSQLVLARLYAPYEGEFGQITVNGRRVTRDVQVTELDGRPVATVVVLLSSTDEVVVRWDMETGPGQTADGELQLTPSVVPGRNRWSFDSAC